MKGSDPNKGAAQTRPTRKLLLAADEFYRSPVFVVGIVAIYDTQFPAFERRWLALRSEIKEQLMRDAPRLADHKRLTGDQLPEIHAVEMVQSDSYYRLFSSDPGYREQYWTRQHKWLEAALKILIHLNARFFSLPINAKQQDIKRNVERYREIYISSFPDYRNKKRAAVFGNLMGNPYYGALSAVVAGMDNYLQNAALNGEMLFDDYDHSKGFYEGDIFTALHEAGHLHSRLTSRHASSLAHNLLQAADVVSYVRGRSAFSRHFGSDPVGRLLDRWDEKYIEPNDVSSGQRMFSSAVTTVTLHTNLINNVCHPIGTGAMHHSLLLAQAQMVADAAWGPSRIRQLLNGQNESEPIRRLAPPDASLPRQRREHQDSDDKEVKRRHL